MVMAGLSQKNRIALQLTSYFWKTLDWLYPPQCCNCERRGFVLCDECLSQIEVLSGWLCKKCGYPLTGRDFICENCRTRPPEYMEMRSWAAFNGPARKALHSLKYHRNLAIGPILAQPLLGMLQKLNWPVDLVIPIPLSKSHFRRRGYNQTAQISITLAQKLNIEHLSNAVLRIKETETQISLDVNQRFTNLRDAFYGKPAKLNKRNILLIDDVITTGATMQNCTNALLKAGAQKVYCLSVARAILQHQKIS
jgi:competence protein ComFC